MKALANASYAALRNKIRETLLLGQRKIDEAKVCSYRETGVYINQHIRINKGRADYGKKVILRLSGDLEIDDSVLRRCAEFADLFPDYKICAARHKLTWAHYRALITVEDDQERFALADQAAAEDWSSRALEIKIRNLHWNKRIEASDGKPPSLLPVPVRGPFYTHKIIAPETVHSVSKQLLLDLGFSCRLEMEVFLSARDVKISATGTCTTGRKCPGVHFPEETIVTSSKDAKRRYSLRSIPSPRPLPKGEDKGEGVLNAVPRTPHDLLYTYKAVHRCRYFSRGVQAGVRPTPRRNHSFERHQDGTPSEGRRKIALTSPSGRRPVTRKYLQEVTTIGYPQAPMEQEAIRAESLIARWK